MSTDFDSITPWGQAAQALFHRYGLGVILTGNVVGAGSVYILSQTGASVGFALLWVMPLAFVLDMVMHDMSARLAARDKPLMVHIRETIGRRPAMIYAVTMAAVMQLWGVANYAVAGAALAWLLDWNIAEGIMIVMIIAMILMFRGDYKEVEKILTVIVSAMFIMYSAILLGIDIPARDVASGLQPGQFSEGALIIALLGTTVYYPNFFIASSVDDVKRFQLREYRIDNMVGIGTAIILSMGIMIVAAVTLSGLEMTLLSPAEPLGAWAVPLFMIAVLFASFTSGTGTLFGSGFAVPQAFGHKTRFNDFRFTQTVTALILSSCMIAVAVLQYTNMTPVQMAITMPAINGLIYLPLTIVFLMHATWSEMKLKQKTLTVGAALVLIIGSGMTAQSLYNTVINFL